MSSPCDIYYFYKFYFLEVIFPLITYYNKYKASFSPYLSLSSFTNKPNINLLIISYFVLFLGKHDSTYSKNFLYATVLKMVFYKSLLASRTSQVRLVSIYAIIIPAENISYLPAS